VATGNGSDLKLFALIAVSAVVLAGLAAVFLLPLGQEAVATMNEGIGLKSAALWGFATTVALFILFAVVSGDSLIGEVQFLLGSFFGFFLVLTLLIAWIF
jgi:hypothetical protein